MWPLKSLQLLNSNSRVSSVDVFRSLAIIAVVLYHFNGRLPYGFLGVDLFFVISGLLVGGLLTRDLEGRKKISFFKFFLQRGFKIWPSYYVFLLLGSFIAYLFYNNSNPEQLISAKDSMRYALFYQNYTGVPFHWSFDHVWSLCVEEHFYILLPLMFLIIQYFVADTYKIKVLFAFVILTILAGIIFKYLSYTLTSGKDTYAATHNRIDALAWGVLLNLLITCYGENLKASGLRTISFFLGVSIFIIALYFSTNPENTLYNKIYFHSIIPFSFFLMLLGAYHTDFSKLKLLRFVAYYSYNWYLWHPLFVIVITRLVGDTMMGVIIYLALTFLTAVVATIFIEEYFLKKRKAIIEKIFTNHLSEEDQDDLKKSRQAL